MFHTVGLECSGHISKEVYLRALSRKNLCMKFCYPESFRFSCLWDRQGPFHKDYSYLQLRCICNFTASSMRWTRQRQQVHRSIYSPKNPWRRQFWFIIMTQNFQERGKMLLSAAILLLGCSSALADGHANNMGCCEYKLVPGHSFMFSHAR